MECSLFEASFEQSQVCLFCVLFENELSVIGYECPAASLIRAMKDS